MESSQGSVEGCGTELKIKLATVTCRHQKIWKFCLGTETSNLDGYFILALQQSGKL